METMNNIIQNTPNEYIYISDNEKYIVNCFFANDPDQMELDIHYLSRWFVNGIHVADIIANYKKCENQMRNYNDDEKMHEALNAIMEKLDGTKEYGEYVHANTVIDSKSKLNYPKKISDLLNEFKSIDVKKYNRLISQLK